MEGEKEECLKAKTKQNQNEKKIHDKVTNIEEAKIKKKLILSQV